MPSATAREFQNAGRKLGFSRTRQTGSHERWNHPDGRAVTIPLHGGGEIGRPCFSRFRDSSESDWKNFSSYARSNLDMQFARYPALLVEVADFGVVGGLFEIVPALTEEPEKNRTS